MKTWVVLFVLWPMVTFAQGPTFVASRKTPELIRGVTFKDVGQVYSVNPNEVINSAFIADFKGLGQKGMWLKITETLDYISRLAFYDPQSQQELFTVALKGAVSIYQGDFDGNGVSEVAAIRSRIRRPATLEDPVIEIFQVIDNRLFQSDYTEFFGLWSSVGNITGDTKDEILLFHYPKPETYNDGPVDILALSWNGNGFEQIASVSLSRMSLDAKIIDLNNDGQEEIVLLQVIWQDDQKIGPVKLSVYSYTGNPELTLLDEIELSVDLGDEIGMGLWTQPLTEGGRRIVIPIPEPWFLKQEHRKGVLEYRGYRLIANRLVREPELLDFEWEYYHDIPASFSTTTPQIVDGYLQIRDSKRLELIKELPPALPKR